MQIKTFTIPVKSPGECEAELNRFLRSHRILVIKREIVVVDGTAFWAFCVEYLDRELEAAERTKAGKVDYREVLKPEEFRRFSELRDFRKKVAEQEGVPVYAVFTNDQLAQMAQASILTPADLRRLPGVGESRVAKHGDALVALLSQRANPVPG